MRYLDEYRDAEMTKSLAERIRRRVTRTWNIMEVCGGQTHSIVKNGLDQILPTEVQLLHGPGCPVCVTPLELIDQAIALSLMENVTVCSFGDMLRVPGSQMSLLQARARGGSVQLVQSPLGALELARREPAREVVFFAVGFETTAPMTAMVAMMAKKQQVKNFSLLVSHVLVPPALEAMLSAEDHAIDGFLAAGHVCTVMGVAEYPPIAERHRVPIVVTGFEPVDILEGVLRCVEQLEAGRHEVENQYARSVRAEGNRAAIESVQRVFEPTARNWRGIGEIPVSGLRLRRGYSDLDAAQRFTLPLQVAREPSECISGLVLLGKKRPGDCPAFAERCTPDTPLGAPMVSGEGACAAYYRHGRARFEGAGGDGSPRGESAGTCDRGAQAVASAPAAVTKTAEASGAHPAENWGRR